MQSPRVYAEKHYITVYCEWCGEEFTKLHWERKRFCGPPCGCESNSRWRGFHDRLSPVEEKDLKALLASRPKEGKEAEEG